MEPGPRRNSPRLLLRPGPGLERKGHARRGAASLPGWRAPPPARTHGLPGVASAVPERPVTPDLGGP